MKNESLKTQLKSFLNCDLKSLFPLARSINRKLYFFVGPTNSGKTYEAIEQFKKANTGIYLAPLRLLALENYENLKNTNIQASLITGEEQIFNEDASHVCSTIEMLDYNLDADVCVIDEVQMLDDHERGWVWVNAILGAPCKNIIMTGSVNALDVVKKIALYLGEELEITKFQRKTPLKFMNNYTNLRNITKKTALITFSRKDVLYYKNKLQKFHRISIIYGNLSPEVRREEARRFREEETDILIATDAISMGLNLPIKTILFTTHMKFDGKLKRNLLPNEVMQISGRAGRYGFYEYGLIGATNKNTFDNIANIYSKSINTIKQPLKVKASNSQIEQLSVFLKTHSLKKILNFFARNMTFDGPFKAISIKSMIDSSQIVENHHNYLTLEEKYILSQAPINTKSIHILNAFKYYIKAISAKKAIKYKLLINVNESASTEEELLKAEDESKKISLYLWLSYKLPDIFIDGVKALEIRLKINKYIQRSLKNSKNIRRSFKSSHKKYTNHKRHFHFNNKQVGPKKAKQKF